MNWLDMHTVMFGHLITDVLGVLVVLFLWRQNRERYRGISRWATGFALQTAGTALIMARGSVPDWVSMTLANALVLAGVMTIVSGIYRFVDQIRSWIPDIVLLGVFVVVSFYFVHFRPSLEARNIAISASFLIVFSRMVIFWFRSRPDVRRLMARIGHVYIALVVVSTVRIIGEIAIHPNSQDFFKSGWFDTLVLLAYQAIFILLTYDLALMVNERLIGDLRFQEEKFSKAFRSSPYAISLTDVETGRIFEINDGFINILGYTREEAAGKTTLELKIWERDEDRRRAVGALSSEGKIHEMEFRFRTKSGEIITGLWSAEQIMINSRPSIYASINNISIRKKALDALNRSVQEKELLMKELKHRVKNSLTIVSSLLGFSREAATDPEVKMVFTDLRSRIASVSSVYEQLDQTGCVDIIGLKGYIQNLADTLIQSYGPTDGRIRLTTHLADLNLETNKALPLGLIINELIINAFKYAYPEGMSGEIRVEVKSVTGRICVMVSDDGVGKKPGVVSTGVGGFGTTLIETLADQIGAHVSYPPGPGTSVVIII
ncbi:MAG: sensor histidine kinase [Candidatus Aminicenantales bacterium]